MSNTALAIQFEGYLEFQQQNIYENSKEEQSFSIAQHSYQREYDNQNNRNDMQVTQVILKSKSIRKNNDSQKKKKIRKEMSLFEDVRRNRQTLACNHYDISSIPIYLNLTEPKVFLLAGGIVVELANQGGDIDNDDSFKRAKFIQKVSKFNDDSIIVNITHTEAQHNFERVIKILQSTQNIDDYKLSVQLTNIQQPIYQLKEIIEQVTKEYQSEHLLRIIQSRKYYIQQAQYKYTQQFLKEDDFGQSVSYIIDWNLKSMTNQHFFISKPTIALLGACPDDFIAFVMRKSLFWLITPQSRRKMLGQCIKFLSYKERKCCSFTFPNLELKMIDDIMLNCEVELNLNLIQYPPELCFFGPGKEILNNSDCISTIKFNVSQSHLEKIIKIRQQQMQNICQNQMKNQSNNDEQIINDFEYYMQSQIFLEKFYLEKSKMASSQTNDESNRCNYKYIEINRVTI